MSTLEELRASVIELTTRSDKVELIDEKINAACRLVCRANKNWRDIVELVLEADDGVLPTSYTQSILIPSDFRSIIYMDYPAQTGCFLTGKKLDAILDRESRDLTDIYYVSGTRLHVRQSTLASTLLLGYYSLVPELNETTQLDNWVSIEVPELVIDLASHFVLGAVGEPSHSRKLERLSSTELLIYIQDLTESISSG